MPLKVLRAQTHGCGGITYARIASCPPYYNAGYGDNARQPFPENRMDRAKSFFVLSLITLVSAGCKDIGPFRDCVEVTGSFDAAAPGYLVAYEAGVDAIATTAQLETKHGFTASHVWPTVPGFGAQLSTSALAGLRCESVVARIRHNSSVRIATP